jgi:hypothetical protein
MLQAVALTTLELRKGRRLDACSNIGVSDRAPLSSENKAYWSGGTCECYLSRCSVLPTNLRALPAAAPQTVASYLALRANQGRRPATLRVTLRAILQRHESDGHASPTADPFVKKTWWVFTADFLVVFLGRPGQDSDRTRARCRAESRSCGACLGRDSDGLRRRAASHARVLLRSDR